MCDTDVKSADCIKYLGALLDKNLTFRKHIMTKCRSAMLNLMRLKTIADSIDKSTLTTLVVSLVISQLDYANCILTGLPEKDIQQMQKVQNMAAKLICGKKKYDSNVLCLKELHWLPIRSRIMYKMLCIVFKCLNNQGPKYLCDLLAEQPQRRENMRSSNKIKQLIVPRTTRKTFADRSFSVAGPKLWNDLPDTVKQCQTYEEFKKRLKMHLFIKAFY